MITKINEYRKILENLPYEDEIRSVFPDVTDDELDMYARHINTNNYNNEDYELVEEDIIDALAILKYNGEKYIVEPDKIEDIMYNIYGDVNDYIDITKFVYKKLYANKKELENKIDNHLSELKENIRFDIAVCIYKLNQLNIDFTNMSFDDFIKTSKKELGKKQYLINNVYKDEKPIWLDIFKSMKTDKSIYLDEVENNEIEKIMK